MTKSVIEIPIASLKDLREETIRWLHVIETTFKDFTKRHILRNALNDINSIQNDNPVW